MNREKITLPIKNYASIKEESSAVLIKADGTVERVKPKDAYFTLIELQRLVGGLIELYPKRLDGDFVVCNEEGLIRGLPINHTFRKFTGITLVGDIFVCPETIFEKLDDEDE